MNFNAEYLEEINNKKRRHPYYEITVDHARDMGVHVEGETPEHLLNINRPNEPQEIKDYRLKSYQPVTLSLSEKVVNTVNKVFNPRLYSFDWQEQNIDDSLEKYLTVDYPYYRSIMNFITETFTQKDFSDPNAVIVIEPKNYEIADTERYEPIATVYSAESVADYGHNYYTFLVGKNTIKIVTDTDITIWEKVENKWVSKWEHVHGLEYVPAFRIGGVVKGDKTPYYYESFVHGVLPHWNQVVQMTSDLQAAYINHLYMEKWEFETDCQADGCNAGYVNTEIGIGQDIEVTKVECKQCHGRGKVSKSPFGVHTVNRDALNPDLPLPTPPAGYISKDINIVDKVEDRIAKEEKRGLASINMEIVQMVGNDQSGVAKTVDREDLNAFLSRYSRHVFEYVLPELIFGIAKWRYGFETQDVKKLLPIISQPKDFNILTLQQLSSEYKEASSSNVSDGYLQHIELEIVQSKFANNDHARKLNKTIIMLNPYPGKSVDDMLTLQNLGEKEWNIYKAIHLIELVNLAIDDNDKFLDLELKEKREVINQMAKDAVGFVEENPIIETEE